MSISLTPEFFDAIRNQEPVRGLTHEFYRYPARFSPLFVNAALQAFTQPGDIVVDPFMGGGTTLVESRALGGRAVGADISSLAVFLARVKTTPLSSEDINAIRSWAAELPDHLNLRSRAVPDQDWREKGYYRNITGRNIWHIRKTLELGLAQLSQLPRAKHRRFGRCVWLKTAQWALDCKTDIPTAKQLRQQFGVNVELMLKGAAEYAQRVAEADSLYETSKSFRSLCLHRSSIGIQTEPVWAHEPAPTLVLTSPPYPGVHVLYHRWQVHGRKETPAPFWIAGSLDGNGEAYYTMGSRKVEGLDRYFRTITSCYESIAKIASQSTLVVQMLAFTEPEWQLPKYNQAMEQAGFTEIMQTDLSETGDARIWRQVPNRKWYAEQKGPISASKEVVLFHRKRPR